MNKEWSPVLHLIYRVLADRTTPPFTILQFTLQVQIINHWKAWHMKAVRQWQCWGIRSGVKICWARDNENCGSAPAVTRTSCASNWFRGRWRGNVKFYYLTHFSWFMIVIAHFISSRRRGEGPLTGRRCWSSRCPSRWGLAGGSGSGRRTPAKGHNY